MVKRQQPNRNAILMACRVPDHRNLYVIGTLARRVSFATQQRRAFNLPQAIDDDLRRSGFPEGLTGKNVAVVGASLAGMTVSLALSAFKANVYIYDAQNAPMEHLSDASHRPIHPSINFWPREAVHPVTEFPLMNWFQDDCASVQKRLVDDHIRLHKEIRTYQAFRRLIRYNRPIDSIVRVRHNEDQWATEQYRLMERVDRTDPSEGIKPISYDGPNGTTDKYDILILAVGFGTDSLAAEELDGADGPHSYWHQASDFISMEGTYHDYKYAVITGSGDGGLIELIRLLMGEVFSFPYADEVGSILHDDTLCQHINRVESEAAKRYFDAQIHHDEGNRERVLDDISVSLKQQYLAAARIIADGPADWMRKQYTNILEKHQRGCPRPPVRLLGLSATAYELGVAPIHKLITAFAEIEEWFEFVRVDRDWKRDPKSSIREGTRNAHTPLASNVTGNKYHSDGSSEPFDFPNALVIERHGAVRELKLLQRMEDDLRTKRELESGKPESKPEPSSSLSNRIRRLQLMYSENDWIDPDAWEFYINQFFEKFENCKLAHAQFYKGAAAEFLQKFHSLQVDTHPDGYYVYYSEEASGAEPLIKDKPPDTLFSVELRAGQPPSEPTGEPIRSL